MGEVNRKNESTGFASGFLSGFVLFLSIRLMFGSSHSAASQNNSRFNRQSSNKPYSPR